jgi:hypothetical protein
MAGESFYAYVGTRGSGKSHEASKRIIEQVWLGRDTVVVNPDFRVDRLVEFLNNIDSMLSLGLGSAEGPEKYLLDRGIDLTEERVFDFDHVSKYCRVFDYDVLEQKSGFWPEEEEMRVLLDSNGNRIYDPRWRPDGWRRQLVRAGSFVVVDEAWRLMDDATRIPPSAKKMFRMMRHWRGPIDWRDPEDVKKYLCDEEGKMWDPSMGGPVDKGGDGTQLVSMNLLVMTQDYQALDSKLRRQVNQITDLFTYPKGHLSGFLAKMNKAWDLDGKYSATTFPSHLLPARGTLQHLRKRESFEILPHIPEVHALTEKAGGASVEARIDNRSTMSNSVEAKTLRSYWKIFFVIFVICGAYFAWFYYNNIAPSITTEEEDQTQTANRDTVTQIEPQTQTPTNVSVAPSSAQPSLSEELPKARVVGTVGNVVVVKNSLGLSRYASLSNFQPTPEMGLVGDLDGVKVHKWSSPIVHPDDIRSSRNRSVSSILPGDRGSKISREDAIDESKLGKKP